MDSPKALLGAVAGRFLFRHGEVTAVARLSEHFARIDVAGRELERSGFVPGDKVQLFLPGLGMFGPRRSIDVRDLAGPLVVVGDETSVALAASLTQARAEGHVTAVLEAESPEETRDVVRQLQLTHVTVTARGQLEQNLLAQLDLGATPLFTGRAVGGKTKAYWADGKRGLD